MMRRWHILLMAGLLGVASLLFVPFEVLISTSSSPIALRGLAIVQPTILTAIAILLGELTAPRVGLRAPLIDAWLNGDSRLTVLRKQVLPALVIGAAVSLILVIYELNVGRNLISEAGPYARLASFDVPLITKLLYGGITEELLTRWALVSTFAWIGWRLSGRPSNVPWTIMLAAVVISALIFAAGHLPLLFLASPNVSTSIIAAVLAGNAVPGILFGALYVRQGIEAAVLAHMSAHLLAALALAF